MAFSAAQLATMVNKAKLVMGLEDDDEALAADGIACFCDATDATIATVQVTDTTWVGIITSGTSAGTTTKTFADTTDDTLGELAATIQAVGGWTCNLVGQSDVDSTLLYRLAATDALGQAAELTLRYENEEMLELLITNALDLMETECGREFISATYSQIVHHGGQLLALEQPEVTAVGAIFGDLEDAIRATYTGSDTHARVEVTDTSVIQTSRGTGTTDTTTTTLFADQATTALMASTMNAVGGWTVTSLNTRPSSYLVRTGGQNAKDRNVTLEAWDDVDIEYEVDYPAGLIEFHGRAWAERGRVRVDYTAGYTDLPADLETVLLALVKTGWDTTRTASGLKAERLGDYAYTVADTAAATAGMVGTLADHEHVLGRYRRTLP